jgi:predicted hydrocarbon binding protein
MQKSTATPAQKTAAERKAASLHLPAELLAELQRSLEDRLGEKAGEFFYSAAETWAAAEVRRLKLLLAKEPPELAAIFCRALNERGWGLWQVEKFEPQGGLLRVTVVASPLAGSYGQSESPVCHLFCGAVAGLAQALMGMPVNASELTCAARGESHCLFEARALSEVREESWQW